MSRLAAMLLSAGQTSAQEAWGAWCSGQLWGCLGWQTQLMPKIKQWRRALICSEKGAKGNALISTPPAASEPTFLRRGAGQAAWETLVPFLGGWGDERPQRETSCFFLTTGSQFIKNVDLSTCDGDFHLDSCSIRMEVICSSRRGCASQCLAVGPGGEPPKS